jgi:cytochrome c
MNIRRLSFPSPARGGAHRRLAAVVFGVAALGASAAAQAQLALAQQKGCTACHAVDKKVVGPAYHDVAVKYAPQKNATDYLSQKVLKGSVGVWGQIPMPPNAVSEAEARQLVQWILTLK